MGETQRGRRYLTGPQVRQRYGGRSDMWLWRRDQHDTQFPKPLRIGGIKFYDEDQLDAYDAVLRQASEVEARDQR